jgi:A/G-specific adenine glycosylase
MQGNRHSYAASPIRRLHKRSCTGGAKKSVNMMPNEHNQALTFAPAEFQQALLRWYDRARRDLPWRSNPGLLPDPYRVWLSEIMLQQTVVKAVIPYFEVFLARWPNAEALAEAPLGDVMAAWAGLGYYSRARNLHACAKELARGGFPKSEADLRELPGIGAYTAAAIAAIAFGQPAAAVDGNVERVIARLYALAGPLPGVKPRIRTLAQALVPQKRPGDYAQAMMDLGATVCTPRSPSCSGCPVVGFCLAYRAGAPERYPVKAPKATRPVRRGDAFVIVKGDGIDGRILLRRRPEKGLLGGMMEVPCTEWCAAGGADEDVSAVWLPARIVRHTFTHFHLEMRVFAAGYAEAKREAQSFGGEWVRVDGLQAAALPTVMKKAIAAGFEVLGLCAKQ